MGHLVWGGEWHETCSCVLLLWGINSYWVEVQQNGVEWHHRTADSHPWQCEVWVLSMFLSRTWRHKLCSRSKKCWYVLNEFHVLACTQNGNRRLPTIIVYVRDLLMSLLTEKPFLMVPNRTDDGQTYLIPESRTIGLNRSSSGNITVNCTGGGWPTPKVNWSSDAVLPGSSDPCLFTWDDGFVR